jgi:hypothetical protein
MVGPKIHAESLGSLPFRQHVRHHRLVGRAGDVREHADDDGDRVEQRQVVDQPERDAGEGAGDQAEKHHAAPAKPVRQGTADRAPNQARDREQAQQGSGFGHADVEFLGDVQREKWEDQRPTKTIDEGRHDQDPELARELPIGCTELFEHAAAQPAGSACARKEWL